MIPEEDARLTVKALGEAAATVAVRQLRYELRRRAASGAGRSTSSTWPATKA